MLMVTVLKIRGVNDLRKRRLGHIVPKILATGFITVSPVEPSSGNIIYLTSKGTNVIVKSGRITTTLLPTQ